MKVIVNFYLKLIKIILILILFLSFLNFNPVNAWHGGTHTDLADGLTWDNPAPAAAWWTIELADGLVEERMANPAHAEMQLSDVNKLWVSEGETGTGILSKIIQFARESIFNLLWVIVVWVLLYIWFRLVIWRWTPDIFKKAMMWFVYLIIWVVLIFVAWAMIKIILWVSI